MKQTFKGTSINFFFIEDEGKKIFRVVTDSLIDFYDKYYKEYRFHKTAFENKEIEQDRIRWGYRLFRDLTENKVIVKRDEKKIAGFINLYKNQPKEYNLSFHIRNPNNYNENFERDKEISKEHSKKFFDFMLSKGRI